MTRTNTMRGSRAPRVLSLYILVAAVLSGAPEATADTAHNHVSADRLRQGAALMDGRELYAQRCSACHGARGQGTTAAPSDFSAPEALIRLSRPAIEEALAGSNHNMVGTLPASERGAIIGYLRNYLMLPAPAADTGAGRAIYSRDCSVCHGDRGNAASWAKNSLNPAPADFTAHGLNELTREKMIETVTFGRSGTAMMGFATQLDRDQITAAVDYIRTAFMPEVGPSKAHGHDHGENHESADEHNEHQAGGHGEDDQTFPGGLAGDPVWGKAFYEANCAECHGEAGDGRGRRAYFMIVKPKNFLSRDARAELDREHLFEEIGEGVTGTTMPSWEKVLSPQEIANVAEYVYRTFLRPEEFTTAPTSGPAWTPAGRQEVDTKKN